MNETTQTATPPPAVRRRHWLRWSLLAVVLVVVGGFVATYLLFFTGSSPAPFKLSTPAATGAGATATTASGQTQTSPTVAAGGSLAGTWTVGSGSEAGYRVREQLARLPAQSDAVGRTSAVTGTIAVSDDGSQLVVASGAKLTVDVTKLTSDESMRDNQIKRIGLQTNTYPTATFVTSAPINLAASAGSGGQTNTQVTGDLTIHGVTKSETIPLQTQLTNGRIEVVGSLSFPFGDFGMTKPDIAGFVTVTNTATLEFQIFFDHTAAT